MDEQEEDHHTGTGAAQFPHTGVGKSGIGNDRQTQCHPGQGYEQYRGTQYGGQQYGGQGYQGTEAPGGSYVGGYYPPNTYQPCNWHANWHDE